MVLQEGFEIPFQEMKEITKALLQDYAQCSGDDNAIHLDDEVARKRGLPGVIAHGMLIAGFVSSRCTEVLEKELESSWVLEKFQTRFKAMTFPGDRISVGGKIKKIEDDVLILDLKAVNQQDDVKVIATATCKKRS